MARIALLAAAGMTAVLAGPGTAGAQADDQKVDAAITYRCDQPTGSWQVVLRVTATFPARGTAGEPVRPRDVTLELTVPPGAVAGLPGAASATSVLRLDTRILLDQAVATATWGTAQNTPAPVVPGHATVFTGGVTPEPVTATTPGGLAFSVGGLAATITGRTAEGAATEPPNVDLVCVPAADQLTELVMVPVVAAETDDPTTTPTRPKPGIEVGRHPVSTAPPVTALDDEPVPEPPPGCHPIEPPPVPNYQDFCANLTGYANVAKLHGSVLQPTGLLNIAAGSFQFNCDGVDGKICSQNTAEPNLDGQPMLPPAPGSFYAFGFVPTTATMQLTQIGLATIDIFFMADGSDDALATARLKLSARLFDATVNGVPLDLGPNCRTAVPIDAVLTANPLTYSITQGGVLSGTVTIPPFAGCGVTEDLDPILTGLVSGPGNYVKMTQGAVCSLSNAFGCPPEIPIPQR
jgi:hypothetical protein